MIDRITRHLFLLALAVPCTVSSVVAAQVGADVVPEELQGVDIVDDNLGESLPLDLPLTTDDGTRIALGDLFDGDRPVIIQIGYYRCPMLCGLVLNELMKGMKDVDFTAGDEYRLLVVSVDPNETPELASIKKQGYLLEYGRDGASQGFHFTVGDEASTRALSESVGFHYKYLPDSGEYSHAAGVFICTPDGRLSRILYGVKYDPANLRMALLEASEGRIGSTIDRIILWCHVYDPDKGYVLFAFRVMQIGGLLTVVALAGGLSLLWLRDGRARRRATATSAA